MSRLLLQKFSSYYLLTSIRSVSDGLFSDNSKVRSDAERRVVNSIIQGSAADIMKRAMVRWRRRRLVASIHDELRLEVDEGEVEGAGRAMREVTTGEGAGRLRAPLMVNWTVGKK